MASETKRTYSEANQDGIISRGSRAEETNSSMNLQIYINKLCLTHTAQKQNKTKPHFNDNTHTSMGVL